MEQTSRGVPRFYRDVQKSPTTLVHAVSICEGKIGEKRQAGQERAGQKIPSR